VEREDVAGQPFSTIKKAGGTIFQDPNNPHNSIRQMPGNPNSPNAAQQNPYVIFKKNGTANDVNGQPLKSAEGPAAHMELTECLKLF